MTLPIHVVVLVLLAAVLHASWNAVIKAGDAVFADLPVTIEIRNQARVHLWYPDRFGAPYPRLTSARDGIARFLVTCTCVGLSRRPDGGLVLSAPYGLDDLYAASLVACLAQVTFGHQLLHVLVDGRGRRQTEVRADLLEGGGVAVLADVFGDEVERLFLSLGQVHPCVPVKI